MGRKEHLVMLLKRAIGQPKEPEAAFAIMSMA
jgi:hypothetical protein